VLLLLFCVFLRVSVMIVGLIVAFGVCVDIFLALGLVENSLEFAFLNSLERTLMGSFRIL